MLTTENTEFSNKKTTEMLSGHRFACTKSSDLAHSNRHGSECRIAEGTLRPTAASRRIIQSQSISHHLSPSTSVVPSASLLTAGIRFLVLIGVEGFAARLRTESGRTALGFFPFLLAAERG
jgi:hypothetical protein